MGGTPDTLFDSAVWAPALEKFGAVTQLSVALYDADEQIVCGPMPTTPLYEAFHAKGYTPPLFADCVRQCLEQLNDNRPPVVTASGGLAVVGASLLLDRRIVGAAVAGYALVNFVESATIERLARQADIDFQQLWPVARRQRPVPAHRLVLHGELLQVLGETLLRENILRRQSEDTASQLIVSAAAKEEFLAVLSHELRTPLTPILGWTGILKMHSDPKVTHAAHVIERNALFQLRLVEDLLELTRATRGKLALNRKVLCLNDLVRGALEATADAAHKKDIGVELVDAPEPVCINGDADRLQQIFRNVLLNGVKFTPAGGTVTIALSSDSEKAIVQVRDTGEGIAPEFLPHVFEMFQQQEQGTRRTHPGLGIGLALVRHLTEAHGGAVSVTSEGVGRGTEVTIQFPVVPGLSEEPESPPVHSGRALALDGLRILVIEDTEDALEAMCVTLERFGADVVTAKDGVEALARTAGDDLDLILCDLRMPRMDGFEFIRKLQDAEGDAHPPVIAVSGLASSADHMATQAAGFTGHIDKPFDEVRILDAVNVALAHRPQAPRPLPLRPRVS
jgi:signal transduction histidine kinase/ActR/RegA family two-component response regulator